MNCAEFRKTCQTEPNSKNRGFVAHRSDCTDCAAYYRQSMLLEMKIKQALDVDLPPGMERRFKENARSYSIRRNKLSLFLVSVAAGVLMLGIALNLGLPGSTKGSFQEVILAHVYDERGLLDAEERASIRSVREVFGEVDIELVSVLDGVRVAMNCPIDRKMGVHLIIDGKKGAVTVLIVPNKPAPGRSPVADGRFSGYVTPAPQVKGSLVILGEKGESLDDIEYRLRNSLHWI